MRCSRRESCSRVVTPAFTFKALGLFVRWYTTLFSSPHIHSEVLALVQGFLRFACSVDLCFCISDDGIDGSGRCFLEYEDSLHTTRRIILTGWEGTGRETDKRGAGVESPAGEDKT